MKILTMEQGSPEWFAIRGQVPSASKFGKIYTPTGKASAQANVYMFELLANWLAGGVTSDYHDGFKSDWMSRGIEIEAEAIAYYEFAESEVERVGFCLRDDHLAGCSPDALMPDRRRGLELKCPKASTHIAYLMAGKLPTVYVPQVQGSMWVTGYDTWDFMSYHPDLEPLMLRIERDDKYIAALQLAVLKFNNQMMAKRQQLIDKGYMHAA